MKPDQTSPRLDDRGLDDLDRESFAWWILGQIEIADRGQSDYSKRSDPRLDALSRIKQACYAIVQDTVLETTPLSPESIILSIESKNGVPLPPKPAA